MCVYGGGGGGGLVLSIHYNIFAHKIENKKVIYSDTNLQELLSLQ